VRAGGTIVEVMLVETVLPKGLGMRETADRLPLPISPSSSSSSSSNGDGQVCRRMLKGVWSTAVMDGVGVDGGVTVWLSEDSAVTCTSVVTVPYEVGSPAWP
jgi:hypothetical protein